MSLFNGQRRRFNLHGPTAACRTSKRNTQSHDRSVLAHSGQYITVNPKSFSSLCSSALFQKSSDRRDRYVCILIITASVRFMLSNHLSNFVAFRSLDGNNSSKGASLLVIPWCTSASESCKLSIMVA